MQMIMLPKNKISFFLSNKYVFYFPILPHVIDSASLMQNKVSRSRHLGDNSTQSFILKYDVSWGLFYRCLCQSEEASIPSLLKVFME